MSSLNDMFFQDKERQQAQIGIMVEFAIALIGKLDGINRHSFNSFRLRVGECAQLLGSSSRNLSLTECCAALDPGFLGYTVHDWHLCSAPPSLARLLVCHVAHRTGVEVKPTLPE